MVTRRENVRNYIRVIIKELPRFFSNYTVDDQKFLTLFLKPLNHFEEADNNRERLAERLNKVQQEFIKTEIYVKHPFSWFAASYFENAEVALQISSFHADNFFDYILPILRGTAGEDDGFFQLIRKGTPLTDLKWEKLQYMCSKLHVPLTADQLQLLNGIYENITIKPWNFLRPRRLRSLILDQNDTPNLSRDLPKFFSMLNSYWTVWPYYPAFGLQTLFFHCKLSLNTRLEDIIDFQEKENQILRTSVISSVRNSQNEYIGVLMINDNQQSVLHSFFEQKMVEGLIKSFKLEKILENRWSYSLKQYRTTSGWQEVPKSQWDQQVNILKLKSLPRRRKAIDLAYLTPKVESNWNYLQLSDPYSAIEIICKKNSFTFNDLLTGTFESAEYPLLRKFFEKNVLFLDFIPSRIRDEYSLDVYWIKTPKISLYQIKRFLNFVPDARTVFTENNCYLRTHLSNFMVKRITRDLNWDIYPVLPAHNIIQRDTSMFDKKSISWRIPRVLTD
jgi:hypothetical protein